MSNLKTDAAGGTTFISLVEIKARYKRAKRKFHTHRKLYQICRDHCKYGGRWPNMTRNAKLKMFDSAKRARHLQQLKQHLESKAASVSL